MKKKILLVFVFFIFMFGAVFADNDSEENIMPKNTITVDAWLAMTGFIMWGIIEEPFWGVAAQYERQITDNVSIAGRLDYRGLNSFDYSSGVNMSAISAEGHGRYYSGGARSFIDGMLGYAAFNYTYKEVNKPPDSTMLHFLKLGGKVGWRIDFGKPGGFVLEPSLGYYAAFGKVDIDFIEETDALDRFINQNLRLLYRYIIKGFFVGGPQLSLGLGYRF